MTVDQLRKFLDGLEGNLPVVIDGGSDHQYDRLIRADKFWAERSGHRLYECLEPEAGEALGGRIPVVILGRG